MTNSLVATNGLFAEPMFGCFDRAQSRMSLTQRSTAGPVESTEVRYRPSCRRPHQRIEMHESFAVRARGISRSFGEVVAVDGVDSSYRSHRLGDLPARRLPRRALRR